MKRLAAVLAVLIAASFYAPAFAAESFTVTAVADVESDVGSGWAKSFQVIKAAWTAAADGSKANATIPAVKGRLLMIVTDPGATAPADNYDLTILDQYGVDVAGGTLANRDTANSEAVQPLAGTLAWSYGRPIKGPLTVTFTAQANANCDGEIYLFVAE